MLAVSVEDPLPPTSSGSKGLAINYGEGGGGGTKREVGVGWVWGHGKFYPYEKRGGGGGAEQVYSHVEGGGAKSFHSLKAGVRKVLPCLEEGTQKVADQQFSNFVAPPPPLPVINDQSLKGRKTGEP